MLFLASLVASNEKGRSLRLNYMVVGPHMFISSAAAAAAAISKALHHTHLDFTSFHDRHDVIFRGSAQIRPAES